MNITSILKSRRYFLAGSAGALGAFVTATRLEGQGSGTGGTGSGGTGTGSTGTGTGSTGTGTGSTGTGTGSTGTGTGSTGTGTGSTGTGTGSTGTGPSDLDVLNFALRLERLESSFYAQGLAKFSASDFASAKFAAGLSSAQSGSLYSNLQAIRDHEAAHVTEVLAVINQLGGTPPPVDTYVFSPNGPDTTIFASPDSFIGVARTLENTGTSAYDGAIGLVTNPLLRTAAASIATVEARHAAYLNELNGQSPFPAAFDTPLSMQDVLSAVSVFLTNPQANAPIPPTISLVSRNITTGSQGYMLDVSKSTAANGGQLRYIWENYLGGPYVKFSDPNSPTPTVTFQSGPGLYIILLSVIDQAGVASSAIVKIMYTGM